MGKDPRLVCEADKANRTITFYVRDGFGDGTDSAGLALVNSDRQERELALSILGDAIDVITGKTMSAVPVERWVALHASPPSQLGRMIAMWKQAD
jgi:hypothetical protein